MSEKKPLDEAKTHTVLADVLEERRRQHEKWGEQNLPDDSPAVAGLISRSAAWARDEISRAIWWDQQPPEEREKVWATPAPHLAWPLVLFEEFAEALEEAATTGTFDEPRSDPNQARVRLRAELVQVAAVAVQWIEALDRRGEKA